MQAGTITGSIGVIYGKLNIAGGLDKVRLWCCRSACMCFVLPCLLLQRFLRHALMQVGITTDIVAKGDNAAATSPFTDFTKQQLVQVQCPCTCARTARM